MLASLGGEAAHDAELAEVLRASILDSTARQLAEIYRRAMNRGELADSPNAEAAASCSSAWSSPGRRSEPRALHCSVPGSRL